MHKETAEASIGRGVARLPQTPLRVERARSRLIAANAGQQHPRAAGQATWTAPPRSPMAKLWRARLPAIRYRGPPVPRLCAAKGVGKIRDLAGSSCAQSLWAETLTRISQCLRSPISDSCARPDIVAGWRADNGTFRDPRFE